MHIYYYLILFVCTTASKLQNYKPSTKMDDSYSTELVVGLYPNTRQPCVKLSGTCTLQGGQSLNLIKDNIIQGACTSYVST